MKTFVPLPSKGRRTRVHAEQKVKAAPLPPRPPGVPDTVDIGELDYRLHEKRLMETEPVAPAFDDPKPTCGGVFTGAC